MANPEGRYWRADGASPYDNSWQAWRKGVIQLAPLCIVCLMENRPNETAVYDHLIPARGNGTLFGNGYTWTEMLKGESKDNSLLPLCVSHHGNKTGAEKRGFTCRPDGTPIPGRLASKAALLEWGYDRKGLPIDSGAVVKYLRAEYRQAVGWDASTGPLLA